VPAGGSRRGRRDNGLSAAEYAAVGDVDPRVGEHLLDVLAGDGIAAYLLPATDLHPVTRTTTLPAVPTDRLYADREHLGTAKEYLAQLRGDEAAVTAAGADGGAAESIGGPVPESAAPPDDFDLDAAWASIVAGYDEDADDAARWPASENLPARSPDDTDPDLGHRLDLDTTDLDEITDRIGAVERPPVPGRRPDEPTLLDALDTFGELPGAADDEGYIPPPPPPVPRPSKQFVLALLGIVVGLLLFFQPELLPVATDVVMLLGFGLLLSGVITLIWRLRPGDEEDDGPDDDGAVVCRGAPPPS
jgi:hypothetical protein